MTKEMIHCCNLMDEFLADIRIPLNYDPRVREYFVSLKQSSAIQLLFYCPWCGKKLPEDVRKEFFEILKKEYGIEDDLNISQNPKLPEEFKSDAWWKKRGL